MVRGMVKPQKEIDSVRLPSKYSDPVPATPRVSKCSSSPQVMQTGPFTLAMQTVDLPSSKCVENLVTSSGSELACVNKIDAPAKTPDFDDTPTTSVLCTPDTVDNQSASASPRPDSNTNTKEETVREEIFQTSLPPGLLFQADPIYQDEVFTSAVSCDTSQASNPDVLIPPSSPSTCPMDIFPNFECPCKNMIESISPKSPEAGRVNSGVIDEVLQKLLDSPSDYLRAHVPLPYPQLPSPSGSCACYTPPLAMSYYLPKERLENDDYAIEAAEMGLLTPCEDSEAPIGVVDQVLRNLWMGGKRRFSV
ncbi:hypothetical protein BDQ17DRAFT_1354733 [Cyathus striatus]|nr:hypothetical protein BDQ17DRAFT_1354733 [Cyathus striatus]